MRERVYEALFSKPATVGRAVLALHHGKMAGIGHFAGHYDGTYAFDAAKNATRLRVTVTVPPGDGIIADAVQPLSRASFSLWLNQLDGQTEHQISLAGSQVRLKLRHVGPFGSTPAMPPEPPHPERIGDGMYRLLFGGARYTSVAVMALKNGHFAGVGEHGSIYGGVCTFDPRRALNTISGTVSFPPGIDLVTGMSVGTDGAVLPLVSEVKYSNGNARFSGSLAHRTVDVALTYVRSLPVA